MALATSDCTVALMVSKIACRGEFAGAILGHFAWGRPKESCIVPKPDKLPCSRGTVTVTGVVVVGEENTGPVCTGGGGKGAAKQMVWTRASRGTG